MNNKSADSRQLNAVQNAPRQSAHDILTATIKRSRQRVGYVSVFATLPALLLPNIHEARTEEVSRTNTSFPEKNATLNEWSKPKRTSELLKRQSKFRLPHQSSFALAADNDDCPGRAIAGGSYSATTPFVEVGDTTGATNTVKAFYCYACFYLTVDTPGPDHIYSFILNDRGANPKIEVSTSSPTFKPLIYVLEGGFTEACPTSTNFAGSGLMLADSSGGVATISSQAMERLPLHVPLYLLVDSRGLDAGSYTLKIQDVTIAPPVTHAIDDPGFFVLEHYFDFLGRFPDPDGLRFWMNEITSCGNDQACIEVKRINVSGAFFLSIEFQETGYLLYRAHKAAYGNLPNAPVPISINEFWDDRWKLQGGLIVNQPGWQQVLENNKQKYFLDFVRKQDFFSAHPDSLTPSQFVDELFSNAGVNPTSVERQAAINEFGTALFTADISARARAFRRVAENSTLAAQEFNRAFVLMQYFGYLHRSPNNAPDGNFDGFNFWLDKLNKFNGDFIGAEMVKAFLSSHEYRARFE